MAQAPAKQWDKTVGTGLLDIFRTVQQTADGGYILGGHAYAGISGDKTQPSQGGYDYWIVKLDSSGTIEWDRSFGSNQLDQLATVQQTQDGGYILGGTSVTGSSGDKTETGPGQSDSDFWVIKLDARGSKQWDHTFGGTRPDLFYALVQTRDGGYLLGGESLSERTGDKTQPSQGDLDYWVVKIDAGGTKQWDKSFGGNRADNFRCLQQTNEGGYILGGYSTSGRSGDKTQPNQGADDYWVVKVDATGTKQWDKSFGSGSVDVLSCVQQTRDGGYLLAGQSYEGVSGDKTQRGQGESDAWVVKVDAAGSKEWDRSFGGEAAEFLASVVEPRDGGYLLGVDSQSPISGDKTESTRGGTDFWFVKLDAEGRKQWDRTFGGTGDDVFYSLQPTRDGGYVAAGASNSDLSGDKTQASRGNFDYWVVKLGPDHLDSCPLLSAFPNPATTHLTLRGPVGVPYQLLNVLGQVVRTGHVSPQRLDVQALPVGVYLLREQGCSRSSKLVKQ